MDKYIFPIVAGFFIWLMVSVMASEQKARPSFSDKEATNCGKTYPIDYIIATNLFCEIK